MTDGLWGLLIVDNKPEAWGNLYDDELTFSVVDWYQTTGENIKNWYLSENNSESIPPFPQSILINGKGSYPCRQLQNASSNHTPCSQTPIAPLTYEVIKGLTYRIRVLSAASARLFTFSIDNHTLQCIEVDGIDTEVSEPVDNVLLSAGWRYSFIVHMNVKNASSGSEFYVRAKLRPAAYGDDVSNPQINSHPEFVQTTAFAILR